MCAPLLFLQLGPDGPPWGSEAPRARFPADRPALTGEACPVRPGGGASLKERLQLLCSQWEFVGVFGGWGRRGLGTAKWVGRALTGCPQSQEEEGMAGLTRAQRLPFPPPAKCSTRPTTLRGDQCRVLSELKFLPGDDM